MSVLITIDIPPRVLSPNHQGHWAPKSKARKAQRSTGFLLARQQMGECAIAGLPWPKATVRVAWYAGREAWIPDEDNARACLKGLIDGVVDAGVLTDDKGLKWLDVIREVDAELPRVMVLFEEIEVC